MLSTRNWSAFRRRPRALSRPCIRDESNGRKPRGRHRVSPGSMRSNQAESNLTGLERKSPAL